MRTWLALVAIVLALVGCETSGDDERAAPPSTRSAQAVEACRASLEEPAAGRLGTPIPDPVWEVLPPGTVDGRFGSSVAWTGEELVVWGGEIVVEDPHRHVDDGAAYDPARRSWRRVASAPLSARGGALTGWTGNEVLIWGGFTEEGVAADAAAYNPAADTWRLLPDGPLDGVEGAVGGWTGREFVVWGEIEGESRGTSFDPCTDEWRSIAPPPIEPARQKPVWTGRELLFWGGNNDSNFPVYGGAAYAPGTDAWRALPPARVQGYYAPTPVWTGSEMVVWGWSNVANDRARENETVAYNPETNEWRALPAAPLVPPANQYEGTGGESVVWNGEALLAWSGTLDADGPLVLRFDPITEQWDRLPRAPGVQAYSPEAVWTGYELIVLGAGPDLTALALKFAER